MSFRSPRRRCRTCSTGSPGAIPRRPCTRGDLSHRYGACPDSGRKWPWRAPVRVGLSRARVRRGDHQRPCRIGRGAGHVPRALFFAHVASFPVPAFMNGRTEQPRSRNFCFGKRPPEHVSGRPARGLFRQGALCHPDDAGERQHGAGSQQNARLSGLVRSGAHGLRIWTLPA